MSTNANVSAATTIAASVTGINANALAGSVSQTGNSQAAEQNLYFYYPPMSAGFTATGTVSLTYASLPAGARVQFLVRAGNIPCAGGNAAPTVSITAPANNALYNAPASVTVSANAADADGTVTQVEFFANANPIGTATSSPYTVSWTNVAAGSYSLSARATDNAGAQTTSAAVSIVVNALPTVSVTSPASGTVVQAPGTINLIATAADSDGTISKVDFYQGATLVGTATASPYSTTVSGLTAGTYSFTAVATDSSNGATTSAAITVRVNAAPTVAMTSPISGTVVQAPGAVNLIATAADADGTIARVEFYQGTTLVSTVTASPYSFPVSGLAAGSYSFTALAVDNDNAQTTSAAVSVTVNAAPSVAITSPANNASFTAPASITVTATAADGDGTISQVQFFSNNNPIGTATSSPFSINWANVAAGAYSLSAVATDNNGGTTASAAVAITVTVGKVLYYIHPDHLNTPRLVADATGMTVWRRDQQEPFGISPPDENPSGLGVFPFPLRESNFYEDKETGTHYAMFRDCYDPATGRFCQSDPIGQFGGLNVYAYARNNPLRHSDRLGLWSPEGHDRIYEHSLADKLSPAELQHVQTAGRLFDRRTQGLDQTHMHSLLRTGQSVAEMIEMRDTAVETMLLQARGFAMARKRTEALTRFAEACHAGMDADSPTHRDSQGRPRVWDPRDPRTWWGHSPNEGVGGETARQLTPEILRNQRRDIQLMYDFVFGR